MKKDTNQNTLIVTAKIMHIIFHGLDTGYAVLAMFSEEEGDFVAAGVIPKVVEGEVLRLTGEIQTHNKYGDQFVFSECEFVSPGDKNEIISFLSSGLFKGIGPATAEKIVEALGDRTLEELENPDALKNIKGISKKKAASIYISYITQINVRENLFFLQKHGISISKAIRVCEMYSDKTREVVEKNPYALVKDIDGIGFKTADKIAKELGFDPQSPYRIESAIVHGIETTLQLDGHTCLTQERIVKEAYILLENVHEDSILAVMASLIEEKQLIYVPSNSSYPDIKGDRIALRMHYLTEKSIANRAIKILKEVEKDVVDVSKMIEHYEDCNDLKLHKTQKEAIINAVSQGFMIITGGPGTGKTTIIKCIIDIRKQLGYTVALAAPTGRASKRLEEATGESARTIHRLLGVKRTPTGIIREYDENNPLPFDTIIIDEISMADIFIFNFVLKAIKKGANIILVGDKDQLPSVAVGNVLGDLITSGKIPVTCLTEIYRQDQDSIIVQNAHRINRGIMPDLDNNANDFYFMETNSEAENLMLVKDLITRRLPNHYGISPRDIQVLSPSKKGIAGVENLNIELQETLNGKNKKNNRNHIKSGSTVFAVGDKVMQIVNNYDLEWSRVNELTNIEEEDEGVYNGEIGFITDISRGITEVTFEDGKVVLYDSWELGNLMLAYAITVHKSQGCEFDNVILSVAGHSMLMSRNLLYTAITRAKGMVVLVGSEENIKKMVRNNRVAKRETLLKRLLVEAEENYIEKPALFATGKYEDIEEHTDDGLSVAEKIRAKLNKIKF